MSLGIKLDHVRGQGQTGGDRLARVTFRGKNMVPCKDNQGAGVNILHKWVKLFPDGHFQAHKLFPEIMRKSRLFTGYFTFILRKF